VHKYVSATAHAWVHMAGIEDARARVHAIVMDYGWQVINIEHERTVHSHHVTASGTLVEASFRAAIRDGVWIVLSAVSRDGRPGEIVSIDLMGVPFPYYREL
jgi:hypothetical protein